MSDVEKWKVHFKPSNETNITPFNPETNDSHDKDGKEKELIENFSSYTTLHGFHFILDSGTKWRRLLWVFLILCGFAFLFAQVWVSLTKLYAKEVDIRKRVEVSKALPFPSVTICNQNMMKRSKIMGTIAQDYLDQQDHVKFVFAKLKAKDVPSFDVGSTLKKVGHQITEMVQTCEFPGGDCSVKDVFTPAMSSYMHGLCYTFNANTSNIIKVGSGRKQGLVLRLDAQPEEYYGPYSYDATGFKIAVHEPGTFHDIENEGYDVSPGFFTSIRIKRTKTTTKPPPYKSMCGAKTLHNFEKYSRTNCYLECVSKAMADKCGCRIVGMVEKGLNVTRYCNKTEMTSCINPLFQKTLLEMSPETCGCPLECESIKYNVQTAIAYYPSQHLWDSLVPLMAKWTGLNASDPGEKSILQKIVRERNGVVSIFFENLITDVTEEKAIYGLSEFGADIGGNMGLFLGCSLLTVCEFIDLIFMVCLHRWRKNSQVYNKN